MNSFMNQSSNPFQPRPRPNSKSPTSFIEALKSIGGQTVKSATKDLVGGVGRDFVQSLAGGPGYQNQSETKRTNEWEQNPEERIREEAWKIQRHRELTETRVFNRKEEEAKAQIKVVQEELAFLVKELAGIDVQLEKAIKEEIITPGTYHVNFFQKLRRLLLDLRKRVSDSSAWLDTAGSRKNAQDGYWGKVATNGTKFMLSQERTMATQAG
jgi:hypothetical protein